MQLSLHKPSVLHDKALEEGQEYEYIPIQLLDPGDPGAHSTPRKKGGPAAPDALPHELKQMPTQELQQLLNSLQQEKKNQQDASLGSGPDVSSVLQMLLKEGALRTNIPKLSAFSGELAKGEVSFKQWSYELQTLRKSYSDLALREGIQCSFRGTTVDAVRNMGPNVPLDMILKKFTIIYGNVKSFDLLMRDFIGQIKGKMKPSLPFQLE